MDVVKFVAISPILSTGQYCTTKYPVHNGVCCAACSCVDLMTRILDLLETHPELEFSTLVNDEEENFKVIMLATAPSFSFYCYTGILLVFLMVTKIFIFLSPFPPYFI